MENNFTVVTSELLHAKGQLEHLHLGLLTGNADLEELLTKSIIADVKETLETLLAILDEEEVVEQKETLDDFIERVVGSLDFGNDVIESMWKTSLVMAIEKLEQRRGYADCIVPLASGNVMGKLNVNSSFVSLVIDGEEFLFEKTINKAEDHYEEECEEEEEDHEEYHEEDYDPCNFCDCEIFCRNEMTLLDFITNEDSSHRVELHLELIEEELEGKKNFSTEDYELIRYFLKQNPNTSVYEVESLSDRGLQLAWNAHLYLTGKLK